MCREKQHGQAQEEVDHAKEKAVLRIGRAAAVQVFRQAEQHDVAKAKSRHPDLVHQAAREFGSRLVAVAFYLNFGFVAYGHELLHQPPQAELLRLVAKLGFAAHEVDPRGDDAGHEFLEILNEPYAARAMHGRNAEAHLVQVIAFEAEYFVLYGRGVEVGICFLRFGLELLDARVVGVGVVAIHAA